jgi:hypothetical protein
MRLEFCRWLHTYRQLLPLIPFTDEATFTRNGINNTRNSHRWSHENPHGTVETNLQRRFSINVWCGMIDDMMICPVILDLVYAPRHWTQHAHPQYSIDCSSIEHFSEVTRNAP